MIILQCKEWKKFFLVEFNNKETNNQQANYFISSNLLIKITVKVTITSTSVGFNSIQ